MSLPKAHPADRVGNRYRLVEQLGVGGMSVVWRGYDEVLNRQVAVKVLAPRLASDAGFRHRIRMEAMAAARLIHPHITNVYDYGESTSPHGETVPYVVMELVDGESMSARVAREGALPWRDAVLACAEVAAALATAHARGVVHRDVTPGNVMLTSGGAKVVDFGISALAGESDLDEDGSLLGTPAYLAPERLDGGQVSPASDVYALGVVLYRVLTGRLPWQASSTTELLQAHLYVEPAPLPPVDGLPAEVVDLISRCMRKKPADRPGSGDAARVLAAAVGVPAAIPVSPAPAGAGSASGVDPSAHTTILPWSPPPSGTASGGSSATGGSS
ncbi:MAG TPA: serine/threonine-protein kinase, partial [Catenuloplanes sp.]